jgi:hypothetical protein
MKTFIGNRTIRLALTYSLAGGQALHIWYPSDEKEETPICFTHYHVWAHLFDQNLARLRNLASILGVNQIVVERLGQKGQHIDLCGKPLIKAIDLAEKELDSSLDQGYTEDRKGGSDYDNCQNDPLGVSKLA